MFHELAVEHLQGVVEGPITAPAGTKKELLDVLSKLLTLRQCLVEVTERCKDKGLVHESKDKAVDIFFEAEVIILDCLHQVARKERSRKAYDNDTFCFNTATKITLALCWMLYRRKFGAQISSLHKGIDQLIQTLRNEVPPTHTPLPPSASTSSGLFGLNNNGDLISNNNYNGRFLEEGLIAIEDQKKRVVGLLQGGPVIAITGLRGSGKTTLAKLVFDDLKIRGHFKAFAWVSIVEYQTNYVLEDVLLQLAPDEFKRKSMYLHEFQLVQKLCGVLRSKKCLVVLDNLPSERPWKNLHAEFAYQKTESRVVVTTRDKNVAINLTHGDQNNVHDIRQLSVGETVELLRKIIVSANKAILARTGPHQGLKMVEEMAPYCRGLPFAVVLLGNLLASKSSLSEFKQIYDKIMLPEKDNEPLTAVVEKLLWMWYNELPDSLKLCFLYLGIFPKGTEIEVERLHLLWMAEGIISPNDEEQAAWRRGNSHLEALGGRRMVNVNQHDVLQTSWTIPETTHDHCKRLAMKEGCFMILDLTNPYDGPTPTETYKARRLSVCGLGSCKDNNRTKQELSKVMGVASHLRSLLFLNAYNHREYLLWPDEIIDLKNFRLVTVLVFDGYEFVKGMLPRGIEKLVFLKHLSLKGCSLTELQPSIGDFIFLQTLDLQVATPCLIPNVLWKLMSLKHLYLPFKFGVAGDDCKLDFSGLQEFRILKNFDTRICSVDNFQKVEKIQMLDATISGDDGVLTTIIQLMKKSTSRNRLQSTLNVRNFDCYSKQRLAILKDLLICSSLQSLLMEGYIGKLEEIDESRLKMLSLSGSQLVDDPMKILEKLPELLKLELHDSAYLGKAMTFSPSGFPKLVRLALFGLNKLMRLNINEGAMPNLTVLAMGRCKNLKSYEGIYFLAKLQELKVYNIPAEFEHVPFSSVPANTKIEFLDEYDESDLHRHGECNTLRLS